MAISSSEIVVIPKRFSGIRVLLIEHDESSLVQHAYMLSQNSYRVTSTTKTSIGLSMIHNGHLYDCVLVDVDTRETDMVDFIHQVLKRQPELSIIMMVSDDIHMMRFVMEALKNEAILCLVKPCDPSDICNIWTHVCRKRIAFEKCGSKRKSPQANTIIRRVDDLVFKPLATLMINNHEISQEEYDALSSKPVVYMNFSNDVGTSTTRNTGHGKQPIENGQQLEDHVTYQKNRKNNKPRINWTEALHTKFLEALNTLGKQNAYPSEILKQMNVPGLTRNHVASHLQKLQGGEKIIKKRRLIVPALQKGDSLQVGTYASNRSGQLILSDNHKFVIQSTSLQGPFGKLNSTGMPCLNIDNIIAQPQDSALLVHVPYPTTATVRNAGGERVTDHSFGDTFRFQMGETSMSFPISGLVKNSGSGDSQGNEVQMTSSGYEKATSKAYSHHASREVVAKLGVGAAVAPHYNLRVMDATNLSDNFDNGNSGSVSGVSEETLEPFDFDNGTSSGASGHVLIGISNTNSRGVGGSGVSHGGWTPFGLDHGNSKGASSNGVSEAMSSFAFDNGNSRDGNGRDFSKALKPFCFEHYNSLNASGGGSMSEPLAQFDCFGIPIECGQPPQSFLQ